MDIELYVTAAAPVNLTLYSTAIVTALKSKGLHQNVVTASSAEFLGITYRC